MPLRRSEGLHVTARQVVRLDGQGRGRYLDGVVTAPDGSKWPLRWMARFICLVLNYWEEWTDRMSW